MQSMSCVFYQDITVQQSMKFFFLEASTKSARPLTGKS